MALNFPNSPTNGQIYTDTSSGNRWSWDAANTAWISTSTFTQTITVASTPPGSPVVGQLWWNQDYGRLLVYYNDGTSSQWVDASPSDATGAVAYAQANAAYAAANNVNLSAPYNTANAAYSKANTAFTNTSNLTTSTFTGTMPYVNMPTGSILQVVQANTSTTVTSTSLSYVDTNLSATITPRYTTSNILVLVNQQCSYSHSGANGLGINLLRNSTVIHNSIADAAGPFEIYSSATNIYSRHNITYVDSPASTSALTYKTQIRPYSAGSVTTQGSAAVPGKSYIILMEIAG
jgi:hypothetical protein